MKQRVYVYRFMVMVAHKMCFITVQNLNRI